MPEEEYQDTLKRGKTPGTSLKPQENHKNQAKKPKSDAKANINQHTKVQQNVKFDTQVQFASLSKVTMEHFPQGTEDQKVEDQPALATQRKLWDKPIQKPAFEWAFDPQMLQEWNQVIVDLTMCEGFKYPHSKGESYHQAMKDEISELSKFNYLPSFNSWRTRSSLHRLSIPNKLEICLMVLHDKYERTKPPLQPPKECCVPWEKKEKWKGDPSTLTEDNIPHLCEQWHDKFSDIVNDTKKELPLWHEVNHEINLIDDSKCYHYFML
ncbi:hypothetical protein C0995_001239 [Termitomyces sp. Mi166|nr:hypothetical protein C0995_001239 [Termitomyces sp. Mi166\